MHTYKMQHCQNERNKDWYNKQCTPPMQHVPKIQQRQQKTRRNRKEDPKPREPYQPTQNHTAKLQNTDKNNIQTIHERKASHNSHHASRRRRNS